MHIVKHQLFQVYTNYEGKKQDFISKESQKALSTLPIYPLARNLNGIGKKHLTSLFLGMANELGLSNQQGMS
jgi:hypothetical protein